MVSSTRFRNIIILVIIIFLCLAVITISFRGSGITGRIKAGAMDIFQPVQEKMFSFFSPVTLFFSSIGDYIGLRQKYRELEMENAVLRQKYVEDTSIRVENDALRKMLGLDIRQEHDILVVRVTGYYSNDWQSEVIINAGTSGGVQEGMGVVGDRGLVGTVVSAGDRSARVRLISDPQSSLGVRLLSSRRLGLIEGSRDGDIYLRYISLDEGIYRGDIAVTSEFGRYLPADILVGRVKSIEELPGDPYREIQIEPFEDLRRLEYLAVIRN